MPPPPPPNPPAAPVPVTQYPPSQYPYEKLELDPNAPSHNWSLFDLTIDDQVIPNMNMKKLDQLQGTLALIRDDLQKQGAPNAPPPEVSSAGPDVNDRLGKLANYDPKGPIAKLTPASNVPMPGTSSSHTTPPPPPRAQ